jgi:hypothetical protein
MSIESRGTSRWRRLSAVPPRQRELVAEALVDPAEELDEAEDGLERPGTKAALPRDASEVATVGDAVHTASAGAGRK